MKGKMFTMRQFKIQLFITFVFMGLFSLSAQAHHVEDKLLGAWELAEVRIDEEKVSIDNLFGTSEVHQVFEENGEYTAVIGGNLFEGIWVLNDNEEELTIITDEKERYSIGKITCDDLFIELKSSGQKFQFHFEKK